MEFRQLRYFVAIAEYGAFSKAAENTFVAQSALSHQLAQLEDELGARLFHRSRRGVELTEAGRIFLTHAVSILRQIEDARGSVRSSLGQLTGKVVFGVPQSVSNALALPLLQEVRKRYPQIELELTEELTGNLTQQLRTGQLNLAVLFDEGQLGEFAHERLVVEQLSLIRAAQPDERPAVKPVSLKKALALPLILPADPHGVRPIIEAKARAYGYPTPARRAHGQARRRSSRRRATTGKSTAASRESGNRRIGPFDIRFRVMQLDDPLDLVDAILRHIHHHQ
jgi:LysR family nitrogen assimilation transcriptional regulator